MPLSRWAVFDLVSFALVVGSWAIAWIVLLVYVRRFIWKRYGEADLVSINNRAEILAC